MSPLHELGPKQLLERRRRDRLLVIEALQATAGNIAGAARLLRVGRMAVVDRIVTLGLSGVLAAIRKEAGQ